MSELFQPITAEQLIAWIFSELDTRDSVSGFPASTFSFRVKMTHLAPARTAIFWKHRSALPQDLNLRWPRISWRLGSVVRVMSN